ncbi:MAG: response regulator transcription factor [Sulfuricella sp.]
MILQTTAFFDDLVQEMAEPIALIDSRRRIVFCTRSFENLVGVQGDDCQCDHILIPSVAVCGEHGCCWDVIDDYLANNDNGLWRFRGNNGLVFTAFTEFTPIDIQGKARFIAVRIKPLVKQPSGPIVDFFRAAYDGLGATGYWNWLVQYIRKTYDFGLVAWSPTSDEAVFSRGSGIPSHDELRAYVKWAGHDFSTDQPFDIDLCTNGVRNFGHVFPSGWDASRTDFLLVSKARTKIDEATVLELHAAVRAGSPNDASAYAKPTATFSSQAITCIFCASEQQVLRLLVEGRTDKEIAQHLHLSVHTVKNRVRAMMEKAQVRKRTRLVALAAMPIESAG